MACMGEMESDRARLCAFSSHYNCIKSLHVFFQTATVAQVLGEGGMMRPMRSPGRLLSSVLLVASGCE